ncbi:hypothetical protein GCM10023188_42740 [Pontibacter saemangeumensis]|uniref:Uncharacterized protein n=1 Tax=Pontibacter saemangeumensis TaxID=1084525 RepID=A0ABP8M4E7_9BACT
MMRYLLLFISTLLMLFTLSQPGTRVNSFSCVKQTQLKEAIDSEKHLVRRKCAKKCLKHQTRSEQQNAGTVVVNCSQPFYAVVAETGPTFNFTPASLEVAAIPADRKHLSPSLEVEPDPPRFS